MAKRLLSIVMFCAIASALFAGDVATFVNLGFSADSHYFAFAQYGVQQTTSSPYAELSIVKVPDNTFVPQGVRKVDYTKPVDSSNSGQGALFNLIEDTVSLARQYRINHLASGRLLYLLVDGSQASDSLEFRDFMTGNLYKINMLQTVSQNQSGVSSSYHIQLSIAGKNNSSFTADVGNPALQREGVKAYHVKEVILAPDEKSLVLVIQRQEQDSHGDNIRYMVETVKVKDAN